MEIASIKAFVTVAKFHSFSEAAKSLHLTQPAISKRVALLELELKENLFDRVGRKVILTEAGELLLPRCQQILENIEDALLSLENLSGKVNGRLRIATSHHIGLHRLPGYLRQFSQQYPDVDLDIQFLTSEEILNQVEKGGLELGVVTLPDHLAENLHARVLWQDNLKFVVSTTHPLAMCKNITLKELSEHDALLPEKNTFTRDIIESVFAKNNLHLHTRLNTNYLETLKMLTTVGLGWSVLPETMLDNELKVLNVKNNHLTRKLGYIQNRHRTLSNAALAMTGLLSHKN